MKRKKVGSITKSLFTILSCFFLCACFSASTEVNVQKNGTTEISFTYLVPQESVTEQEREVGYFSELDSSFTETFFEYLDNGKEKYPELLKQIEISTEEVSLTVEGKHYFGFKASFSIEGNKSILFPGLVTVKEEENSLVFELSDNRSYQFIKQAFKVEGIDLSPQYIKDSGMEFFLVVTMPNPISYSNIGEYSNRTFVVDMLSDNSNIITVICPLETDLGEKSKTNTGIYTGLTGLGLGTVLAVYLKRRKERN